MYSFSNNQKRTDCESFELRQNEHQNGDCQTDGHFLCANCKHIETFEGMDIADNKMRYYPEKTKEEIIPDNALQNIA